MSIGGNALTGGKGKETIADQREVCQVACEIIAKVYQTVKMALTHGNGPQSGYIAERFEYAVARGVRHPVPFDAIVADTQGSIGYMIEQLLINELSKYSAETASRIATLITQAIVDPDDPAFEDPQKPIGSWMTAEEAALRHEEDGWDVKEKDSSRSDGWRRVVPSPKPKAVTNERAIIHNVEGGFLTTCGGGGGIPVVPDPETGELIGVEGVIDKDLISALIAKKMKARLMAIMTEAPGVIDPVEYEREGVNGKIIPIITVAEAKDMVKQLQKGSMGPKVEACIQFTDETGHPSVIGNFDNIEDALVGRGGTRIVAV